MRTSEETKDITLLGQKNVKYEFNYRPDVLETFDNKHPDHDYWVKFNCPEFTTLCPIQFISLIFLMKKWWKVNP